MLTPVLKIFLLSFFSVFSVNAHAQLRMSDYPDYNIKGKLRLSGIDASKISPMKVLLVRELDTATQDKLNKGMEAFNALKSKVSDVSFPVLAASNEGVFNNSLAQLVDEMPFPNTQQLEVQDLGIIELAAHKDLVERYTNALKMVRPAMASTDVRKIKEAIRVDIVNRQTVINDGFDGDTMNVDLLGLKKDSVGGDMQGARLVAQVTIDNFWLDQMAVYMEEVMGVLSKLPVKVDGVLTPEEAWNVFHFTKAADMDFDISIAILDVTEVSSTGEFELYGKGQVLVALPLYGEMTYFAEGENSNFVRVQRQ